MMLSYKIKMRVEVWLYLERSNIESYQNSAHVNFLASINSGGKN